MKLSALLAVMPEICLFFQGKLIPWNPYLFTCQPKFVPAHSSDTNMTNVLNGLKYLRVYSIRIV